MAKKRANGEGNIRKRKDGRWEGRYTAGYNPETGELSTISGVCQVGSMALPTMGSRR